MNLTFPNAQGVQLAARLEQPLAQPTRAYALFAHCFTCSKNLNAAVNISRALTQAGIAVLRFDFTGLGESEGDFADSNFSSNVDDLVAAAQYLSTSYAPPQLLVGHSLGGAAVLHAAAQLDSVKAVATMAAPANPVHVRQLFTDHEDEIEARGSAEVRLAGRTFTIKQQFLEDLEAASMNNVISNLRRALLVMHAPTDNTVGVSNAAEIFTAAKHPKSFVSLDDADHLLSRDKDSHYAGQTVAAWAAHYLDEAPRPAWLDDVHDNRVAAHTAAGLRTDVMANGHMLVADEPKSVGGTDTGPTPYDLLAAALATCTAMTLRMYANRKQWPLEDVTVAVDHDKVHAKDCETSETDSSRKLDQFTRTIHLVGDLDSEQRARLQEIANRCPVHRTLESDIRILTQLAEDA
ncbi:MAG: bifunctional alpha/beta hydrolase/OsmC family protein [Deinococcota bacterium]